MATQKLDLNDQDLVVRSIRTVDGHLDSSSSYTTKFEQIESSVARVEGIAGEALDDRPPTNNVTNLAFSSEQNPSGMIDVTVSWDYIQGAPPADGFLVFYKRDVTTPGEIDIFRDPSVFVPASSATEYQTILTLPARQAGAGTLPIHYRFGVVAFATRRSGTVVHLAGVVEHPSWIDKTFASKIQVDGNNFWDQDTGELRAGNASSFLHVKPADGTMELGGIDLEITERDVRSYTGQGVQRRAVEVGDEAISWFDSPDTTPASPEQLRARIGRLGVGETVILNGNFQSPINAPYSSPVQINNEISHTPAIIRRANGELRMLHLVYNQRWQKEYINTGSGWSAGVVMPHDASTYMWKGRYIEKPDGTLLVFSIDTNNQIRWQRLDAGTWTSPGTLASNVFGDFDIVFQKNGLYRLICSNSAYTACVESFYDANFNLVSGPTELPFMAGNMRFIEKPSGQIVLWATVNGVGLTRRVANDLGYSSPETIESSIHGWRCDVIQMLDGAEVAYYLKPSTLEIATRKYTDSVSSEVLTGITNNQAIAVTQKNDGTIVVVYEKNVFPFNLFSMERPQYARLGGGFIEKGTDGTGPYYKLFDGKVLRDLPGQDIGGAGIIERGQNSNGEFIKFSDGTMICARDVTSVNGATTTRNWPHAFVELYTVVGNQRGASTSTTMTCNGTATTVTAYNSSTGDRTLSAIGIGRWK